MLEDETHELPLPRRTHTTTSQTSERRQATINTLVVATKRLSDTLSNTKSPDASRVLKDARISLSSGIVDVTIRTPRTQFSTIIRELSEVWSDLSEFPHISPLSSSIN